MREFIIIAQGGTAGERARISWPIWAKHPSGII
jgi:hypothetical protein